ncbi:amidohydrolase family protein [Mesorhizobium sp.]|uniref:amidohydrolase family protein n=1 Tax=Mesorhizobium sp. TaxID=1871066 RepID=UPI000FE9E3E1|nr:amidohydrolase family protein [Mesorhizobium sp.]RWO88572.1 MAG: hypothetical protein EOQ95_18385 [Mesorhizobium sp.]
MAAVFLEDRYELTRRRFMQGVAALLPACFLPTGALLAQEAGIVTDVHCHVFNAHDLPVRGFVQRVVFGDAEATVVPHESPEVNRALAPWIGAVLVRQLLTGAAPSAEMELRTIEAQADAGIESAPSMDSDVATLAEALRATMSESFSQSFENLPAFERQVSGATAGYFMRRLAEEAGQSEDSLLSPEMGADPYSDMARSLLSGDGKISRYFRWAALFNSPRRKIVAEIERLFGGPDRVRLFTPALIDFSHWLDEEPRSNLESQIRVMERIQRLERRSMVHCFVAYDPWREVADQEIGGTNTALDLVKWAINDMGFIGVKLYPPMGFMPAGNEGSNLAYPERAGDIPQFTRKLDEALDNLFSWASSQGVPIMAHSADSNGAGPGYSGRASPANWKPVLLKYPELRLNLAHFGGFEKSVAGGEDWENIRVALVSSGAKNLFADVGFLSEILPDHSTPAEMQRLSAAFASYVTNSDPNVERLMFATDWIMLGQEAGFSDYFEVVDRFTQAAGITDEKRQRFLGGNAQRFLGLRNQEPARTRLEGYYQAKHMDAKRLQEFDI